MMKTPKRQHKYETTAIPENCKRCVMLYVCKHDSQCAFKVKKGRVIKAEKDFENEQQKRNKRFDF